MYLEKLEIQGFKSFANKNKLVFPGMLSKDKRGITAIVGPNGSGKSNVADAVRWALGEQSMKTLRGRKSEDVIFSGSDKKSKLGMAEVSLFLNNADKKAPIDYGEIVLTRRLYRNGDSEYLINDSRVRLSDIQMLLAKASFGQKTYSVIGQGMVEGFLNTSLAERKEFFDEATGVKQFQIKRDEALNKLRASYENLNQANLLLSEIEPRVSSLTRQVNKLRKRAAVETELKEIQLGYYRQVWHANYNKFSEFNAQYVELEKEKITKEKKLAQLNDGLAKLENQNGIDEDFENFQKELSDLQAQKNEIISQIVRLDAQAEIQLEARGKFDLSWLISKKNELSQRAEDLAENLEKPEEDFKEQLAKLNKQKTELDQKIEDLNKKIAILSAGGSAVEKLKKTITALKNLAGEISDLREEKDIAKLKEIVLKIGKELNKLVGEADYDSSREELDLAQRELASLATSRTEILDSISDFSLKENMAKAKKAMLQEEKEKIITELARVEEKIIASAGKDNQELLAKKEDVKNKLLPIEERITAVKEKISGISKQEEMKRSELFSLQRNLQTLQGEVNVLTGRLNDIKVNAAKYEARLENLEADIRENLGTLKDVKAESGKGDVDEGAAIEKIKNLKHQLELIGGIDPEIEKEYAETKERYDFLSGQVTDLENAINSLEKIIKELDLTIKEKFDKEFKLIQSKFQEYFKILFNGGHAQIIKVMEEEDEGKSEPAEGEDGANKKIDNKQNFDLKKIKFLQKHNATGLAGIEIQATPPGKKIKSVSMLSGGERALTAIAMICAIISANPSPFVVLDEVDAALDEANSERLASILDDLSHKTQFIVITHNRASMHKANILYGVSMGEDGVSNLLSIKLEEQDK